MKHPMIVAALLATLAGPALAAPPPPAKPAPDCSGLGQARADARKAAAAPKYDVFDLDGEPARKFQVEQGMFPANVTAEHLTVMVNPATGRAVALINDGPKCAFQSSVFVFTPYAPPLEGALDALRLAR